MDRLGVRLQRSKTRRIRLRRAIAYLIATLLAFAALIWLLFSLGEPYSFTAWALLLPASFFSARRMVDLMAIIMGY